MVQYLGSTLWGKMYVYGIYNKSVSAQGASAGSQPGLLRLERQKGR